MAAMQCDICGERLTMDVSGEFAVCDFCGMKHPKERLMKMVAGINEGNTATAETKEKVTYTATVEVQPEVEMPKPEPIKAEPPKVEIPEPEVMSEPESVIAGSLEEEIPATMETANQPVSEPKIENIPVVEPTVVGAMDIGMEIGDGPELVTPISESSTPVVDEMAGENSGMTAAERAEYEKKANRIKELNDELKEFEEIYEANKNKFLGEGLKRKNYSEIKIKEIKEKLEALGA